ncbi:hypothetical protein SprV_0602171900 [Sparganum proliferum]
MPAPSQSRDAKKSNGNEKCGLLSCASHGENSITTVSRENPRLPVQEDSSATRPDSTYLTTSQLFFRNPGHQRSRPTSKEALLAAPRGRFTAGQHQRKKAVGIVPGLSNSPDATPLLYKTSYNLSINSSSSLVRDAANDIEVARKRHYIGRGPIVKQEATPKTENFIINETNPKFIFYR